MARSLNKLRMIKSKIIVLLLLILVFFTRTFIIAESPLHNILEFVGYFMIAVCALGRIYSTAFLGGFKNEKLITYGAFSIVRNPLYFFSLLGMTGVAFLSGYLVIILVMPIFFIVLYNYLIKREEEFLLEAFADEYKEYMKSTPRLIPNLKLYNAPDEIIVAPRYLRKAFGDAIWWFMAFPIFELAEFLQESGFITPIIMIP